MPAADDPNPGGEREPWGPFPALEHVRWTRRPPVEKPVIVAAFEGWNDAGDAASSAVRRLAGLWHAEEFATIDPEDFYDFTTTRPHVRIDEDGGREIVWPDNLLASARVQDGLDIITLVGTEPQLRWRTFAAQVTGLARLLDAQLVVTVGALLAEVPHTRVTPVYGAGYDDDVSLELGLMPSRYEGPTGIVGVLHAACRDAGLRSASLWAAVPTYVPSVPSPKATLALVRRTAKLLGTELTDDALRGLIDEADAYERQITEVASDDDDTTAYVHRLEAAFDENEGLIDAGGSIADEIEQFLRDHPGA